MPDEFYLFNTISLIYLDYLIKIAMPARQRYNGFIYVVTTQV